MANHLRRQIRERVATMLTGLSTTGSNVFQSHVYPLENADLPALCIYTQDEEIEVGAMGDPRVCHSTMTLIVDGYAQTSSNLDDQLDQIGKEVQVAMAGDIDINNLVKDSYLSSVDISYSGEGTSPIGVIRHNYSVLYRYARMHLTHHYKLIMKMFYWNRSD